MHPTTNIKELVRECESFLRQLNYSEACIAVHRRQWNDGIIPYMASMGIVEYNPIIGADYLEYATKDSAPSTKRARTRNIHILVGFGVAGEGVGAPAAGLKGGDDAAGKEPVLGVFQETAVGAPLALGAHTVAVVDEDLHS